MAEKGSKKGKQSADEKVSAVEATNDYNRHVTGFRIDIGLEVMDVGTTREVLAGVTLEMEDGAVAFIPADFLRALADEAEANARQAIARANTGRG